MEVAWPEVWKTVFVASAVRGISRTARRDALQKLEALLLLQQQQPQPTEPGSGVDARGGVHNCTPLDCAVSDSDLETTMILLAHRADTSQVCTAQQFTALHRAVRGNRSLPVQQEILLQLLAHGADVNARDHVGVTPLHFAALYLPNLNAVRLLIAYGAEVSLRNVRGETALRMVMSNFVEDGTRDIALLLLQHGADINERCPRGRTLLHQCVYNRHMTCLQEVQFLIEQGALDLEDNAGRSAVDVAEGVNEHELAHAIDHQFQLQRDRQIAFAMGLHDRLGQASTVRSLMPEVMKIIMRGGAVGGV
jgi:ankyrin repeat protein